MGSVYQDTAHNFVVFVVLDVVFAKWVVILTKMYENKTVKQINRSRRE